MRLLSVKSRKKQNEFNKRWTVKTSDWIVDIENEYEIRPGEWVEYGHYVSFGFRPWNLGMHHTYYDGPHCCLNLGFIFFGWSLGNCKKCMKGIL